MAIPDYGQHLKGLRLDYVKRLTQRQRAHIALQRMQHPDAGVNLLVTAVSSVEGLARALALNIQIKGGAAPGRAYRDPRDRGAVDLLAGIVVPSRGTTMPALIGAEDWEEFKWAVRYRNLLIHESTFLRAGYCNRLLNATRAVFSALQQMAL
jgi:hypothetical protein